jgi:hypothetical protein
MTADEKLQFRIIGFLLLAGSATWLIVASLMEGCMPSVLLRQACLAWPPTLDTAVFALQSAAVAGVAMHAWRRLFRLLDV